MTSYYLVQDDKGLYYIRRRILGVWDDFLGRTDRVDDIKENWWPKDYVHLAYFTSETDAINRWEQVKGYGLKRTFKPIRKLT